MRFPLLSILFALTMPPTCGAAQPDLWLYYATNLQVDANVDKLDPIWRRAAAAGYTKVLLADNVRACTQLLGTGAHAYVWSDMFDPSHNAHADYYLVRGDLSNSWLGLSPSTTIVNWNYPHRDESLHFFASRHHPQIIAAYYDAPVNRVTQWLISADKLPAGSVTGVMYTTWRNNYADLEPFARLVRAHQPH